jgi:hypothetical protein
MIMDKTLEIIASMFKQNTGVALCDSGGHNGRGWQRRADKSLEELARSYGKIDAYGWVDKEGKSNLDFYPVVNTINWLNDRLCYDDDLNRLMDLFISQDEDMDSWEQKSSYELREEFPAWLHARANEFLDDGGSYCPVTDIELTEFLEDESSEWGISDPITENSYNYDNTLDNIILFTAFQGYCDAIVILQVHNGADARGGYTMPKVFRTNDSDGIYGMLDFNRATVYCNECDSNWESDYTLGDIQNLPAIICESSIEAAARAKGSCENRIEELDISKADWHHIVYCKETGQVYCPKCGEGTLGASS